MRTNEVKRVADAAERHGKSAGVMVGDAAGAEEWMERGYRAIAYGADFRLYADALAAGIINLEVLAREAERV